MSRADGAKVWARVLSELADVPVTVEWERPAWRVYWQDGPTRRALLERAAALGAYRVGTPLPAEQLRFIRSNSVTAVALGWLANTAPGSPVAVQAWCEDTGYPQARFDAPALPAAELLARLGRGDITEMGALLARAVPPVRPYAPTAPPPADLTGRVTSIRWPTGGPPAELLGPDTPPTAASAPTCQRCGTPLRPARRGRPAKFCSGACRVAAHRQAAAA